jgi:hypothetical protein
MIIGVCADKGAPGVTTLATALAVVWPGHKVLAECDPSGADLPFRLRHQHTGNWLQPDPSITALAAVARLSPTAADLLDYAQPCTLGVPVIPGASTAERFAPVKALWPQVAQVLGAWPGTVIADLGRLQPGHPAAAVAKASTVLVLLARADLPGFFHLRDRVTELCATVGDPTREVNPVTVVVTGPAKTRNTALAEVSALLTSVGSPARVAGFIPQDRQAAQDLWAGQVTRRLAGSPLIRSVRHLAEALLASSPELAAAAAGPPPKSGTARPAPPSDPARVGVDDVDEVRI